MITEPTKSSSDLFLLRYYAEGNISTSVNMEIFPQIENASWEEDVSFR